MHMYIKRTTAVLYNDSIMETVSLTEQPLLTSCFKICVFHVIINNSRSETDGCTWGWGWGGGMQPGLEETGSSKVKLWAYSTAGLQVKP